MYTCTREAAGLRRVAVALRHLAFHPEKEFWRFAWRDKSGMTGPYGPCLKLGLLLRPMLIWRSLCMFMKTPEQERQDS
jgi:hypothetical protein